MSARLMQITDRLCGDIQIFGKLSDFIECADSQMKDYQKQLLRDFMVLEMAVYILEKSDPYIRWDSHR